MKKTFFISLAFVACLSYGSSIHELVKNRLNNENISNHSKLKKEPKLKTASKSSYRHKDFSGLKS